MNSLLKKVLSVSLILPGFAAFATETDETTVPWVVKYIDPTAPNAIASVSVKCVNARTKEKSDCPAYYADDESAVVGKRVVNTNAEKLPATVDPEFYNPEYYATLSGVVGCKIDQSVSSQRKPTYFLIYYYDEDGKTAFTYDCELVHE